MSHRRRTRATGTAALLLGLVTCVANLLSAAEPVGVYVLSALLTVTGAALRIEAAAGAGDDDPARPRQP